MSMLPETTPMQDITRRTMTWRSDLPCLEVASVRASASMGANSAQRTIDRNLTTRWAGGAGEQWLEYDLGSARDISGVTIVWYRAHRGRVALRIAVSDDAKAYHEVDSGEIEDRGTHSTLRTFVPTTGRYVKVVLAPAAGASAPSVYEVGIHGSEREARAR
jgi:hypothetical protein